VNQNAETLCADGWHVPANAEILDIINSIGETIDDAWRGYPLIELWGGGGSISSYNGWDPQGAGLLLWGAEVNDEGTPSGLYAESSLTWDSWRQKVIYLYLSKKDGLEVRCVHD
jgi:hypothetical protein